MQGKITSHIGLTFPDTFPEKLIEKLKNELAAPNLNIETRKLPFGGPYASMDWAIPTVIGVYLLKPYFDGFLKELAKDHYGILKEWLKRVSSNARLIKVTMIAASQSIEKLDKNNVQSKVFSIESKTNEGYLLKFLFDDRLDDEQWAVAIDKALNLLNEHFTNGKSDELTIEIKNNDLEKTIYAKLKTDSVEWEFVDYKKIIQKGGTA